MEPCDECPPQAKNLENQVYLRGRPNQHDIDTGCEVVLHVQWSMNFTLYMYIS